MAVRYAVQSRKSQANFARYMHNRQISQGQPTPKSGCRASLVFDRFNFFRLEAPYDFHPMRATQGVQKASEGYSDQRAAPHELSNAYGAELQLLRVRRLAWHAALQFGGLDSHFMLFSRADVSVRLKNRFNFYKIGR